MLQEIIHTICHKQTAKQQQYSIVSTASNQP